MMTKSLWCSLLLALLFMGMILPAQTTDNCVSLQGKDTHRGTIDSPLAWVPIVLREIREMRRLDDPANKGGVERIYQDIKSKEYIQVELLN